MAMVYVFKVSYKKRKSIWREIEIPCNYTLGEFDGIIKEAFNYDSWDHLSEFYIKEWPKGGLGVIYPIGGDCSEIPIYKLNLVVGGEIGYVYDFGDERHNIVTLEKIIKPEKGVEYPRIVATNKSKQQS